MGKQNWKNKILDDRDKADAYEATVRAHMARRGYRLMHRRNGQYWLMWKDPLTLKQIEAWAKPHAAR